MLTHQTIAKLGALGLSAMADGLTEQLAMPGTYDELSFSDRLGCSSTKRPTPVTRAAWRHD